MEKKIPLSSSPNFSFPFVQTRSSFHLSNGKLFILVCVKERGEQIGAKHEVERTNVCTMFDKEKVLNFVWNVLLIEH